MRKLIFKTLMLVTGLVFIQQIYSQQMLMGRITDGNGEGIPGVNILIKGTVKGTISDLDGIYNIEVFMGDIVVISFVGMRTQEVVITEKSFNQLSYNGGTIKSKKKRKVQQLIPQYYNDPVEAFEPDERDNAKKSGDGVMYLGEKMNRKRKYKGRRNDYGKGVLKKIEYDDSLKTYVFNFEKPFNQRSEHFEFNSIFNLDEVTQLPAFQNKYSLGIPQNGQFVYTSPIENNLLCWGPQLSQLEYDGLNSVYYNDGNIVGLGLGNGTGLSRFHPSSYFKNGLRFANSLEYRFSNYENYFYAKYSNTHNSGVMPGSELMGHDFSLGMKSNRIEARAFFTQALGELNMHEGNYSRVLHSLYTTPPEFNNANSYSTKGAFKNSDSYLTGNNTQRSYSANSMENPYWLAANDPSSNKTIRYGVNASYNNNFGNNWRYSFGTSFQKEENENKTGFVSFYTPENGWLINKIDDHTTIKASAKLSKRFDLRLFDINNFIRYLFRNEQYEFEKKEYALSYSQPTSLNPGEEFAHFNQLSKRMVHEVSIGQSSEASYRFPVFYSASLNVYKSSTSSKAYFLPGISLGLDINEIEGWVSNFFPGKIYLAYSKSVKEADFQNRPNHYNTINFNASDFRNYQETKNTYFDNVLKPLITGNYTAGLSLRNIGYTGIELFVDYYYRETKDAFFPIQDNNNIIVRNLANISNQGIETGVSYRLRFYRLELNFSKSKNKVDKLLNESESIPIAGFNDVYKSLIEGEDVGVIVGSRYLRNNEGKLVIGNSGYPLVEPTLGIIGNPNPDWTLNLNNLISLRGFDLVLNVEYKHGGQVWNGTKNVLNYHGVSELATNSRDINGYIFEGVNQNGEPNTIAVDFANPANPISEFRHLRYGYNGVAEDAIEDASWFRIKKVALSYEFKRIKTSWITLSGIRLSCWIENVLTITPYSGVDPQSSLFGYDEAQGLDMFNAPATRRFGFNLNVSF